MTIYSDNSLRPIVGNQYVPDSMEARGQIKPLPPTDGTRNGLGELVITEIWGYEWGFNLMKRTELDWWANLVGFGTASSGALTWRHMSKRFVNIGSGGSFMPAARLWVSNTQLMQFQA